MSELGEFNGKPILKTGAAIKNAGDGLSKALAIEPQMLDPDGAVYVVLRCGYAGGTFKRFVDEDEQREGWELTHVLKAGVATIVAPEVVRAVLDEQQRKLDAAAGIVSLPFSGEGAPDSDGVPSDVEAEVQQLAERRRKRKDDGLDQIPDEEAMGGS